MLGRDEDVDAVAVVAYSQTREPMRAHVRRPPRAGRARAGRAEAARRRPRRPRRRLPPEHPGDARRVPRDREPRCDLGDVPAGVRRPERPPSARPARAEGAARGRAATATARSSSIAASRWPRSEQACRACETVVHVPYVGGADDALPDAVSWDELLAEGEPLEFEPLPFAHPLYVLFSSGTTGLPKAIVHGHGGILLEHLKNHGFSWDLQARRPAPVVHDDRLDDVERARLGAAPARVDRDDRRQPGVSRPLVPVAARRGDEADVLRAQPRVHDGVPQGGARAGDALRPLLDPHGLRGGLAAAARGVRVALRAVRRRTSTSTSAAAGTDVCTGLVQGYPLLPVYAGEMSARCLGVDVGRVRAGREAGRRRARRARDQAADAVDAGRLLGRPRRLALPRGVLRVLPRGLALRRLDHVHRARQRGDHRPLGRDAQPRRRPARDERDLLGRRGARRGARQPRRPPRGDRTSCCSSSCCARGSSSTTSCGSASPARCATRSRRGTRPTRSSPCPRSRGR